MAGDSESKFSKQNDYSRVYIDPNAPWDERNDALFEAILLSNGKPYDALEKILAIFSGGVNINARKEGGKTALEYAKYHECPLRIVTILREAATEGNPTPIDLIDTTVAIEIPPQVETKYLDIAFTGTAMEYFRIWAVNLCLTIITLGLFSPWAKVRKKRYFYSHTLLDGTPFEYRGQPIPILKGRIIAAILFLIWYLSSHLFQYLMPYVIAIGFFLFPWIVIRSSAFNSRNSAWRNMTLDFDGTYGSAFNALYFGGIVPVAIVTGLILQETNPQVLAAVFGILSLFFAMWFARVKRYIAQHTVFGGQHAELSVWGMDFFLIYFISGFVVAGVSIVIVIAAMALKETVFQGQASEVQMFITVVPLYLGYFAGYAYVQARNINLIWNHLVIGPLRFESIVKARDYIKLYVTNALAIIFSLGLLIPWAKIRVLKYRAEHLRAEIKGELDVFQGTTSADTHAAGAEVSELFDIDLSL